MRLRFHFHVEIGSNSSTQKIRFSDCGCAVKRSGYFRSRRTAKRGFPQNQLVERDREKAWRWGGCSVDIAHGLNFTRAFMDSREIRQNERSLMNRHNNKAGRLVSAFVC